MKTRKYLLTLAYICLTLLTACADKQTATDQQKKIDQLESIRDLSTSRVGVITGVVYEEALSKEFPDMHVMYIDDEIGLLQSLQTHRCDAALFDEHTLKFHMQSISGIRILKEPYMTADVGAIFHPESEALRDEFNVFIRQLKADGQYEQLYEKWIEHGQTSHMSDIPLPTDGEPLRVATTSSSAPLVFIKDGKLVGLEVEIMTLFAQHINRPIEWWDMDFSGVLPAVVSKRCDAAVCSINYSEERAKNVIFSDTYFLCSSVVAVADAEVADTAEETNETFFQSLKKTFYQNLIEENRYLLIVDGLKITAWISLFSILFGTLLAIIVCWMSMSPSLTLRSIAKVYINIMQGTPVLVFLLLMFYVVLAQSGMSAVIVSIITFSMNFAAYASEIFRHSIENIPHAQTEAGVALGFTKAQTFIYIVLPQALRLIMPSYKGEVISLVKTTSIVGYIAVADLTQAGDVIRSRTFDAFFPLILVAIVYFILAWLFSKVLDIIGNKIQEYKHIK